MEEKIYIDSTDNIKLCALISDISSDKIVLLFHGIRGNKSINSMVWSPRQL